MKSDTAGLSALLLSDSPAGALPVSFLYDGKEYHGIPEVFHPTVTVTKQEDTVTETVYTGCDPSGLEIRVECRRYRDFAAAEYLAFFTNRGETDSALLESIRIAEGVLPLRDAILYHGNGDTQNADGYEWFTDDLSSPLLLTPSDGTSCNGAFPYMRLKNRDGGVNIAIGWPFMWQAAWEKREDGVFLSVGQRRCHTVLHPGETYRTPRLTLAAYEGDNDAGINAWRRFCFRHILPREPDGSPLSGKYCLHHFMAGGHPEFTGADEENQITALNRYLEKGLKPDVWWIDAGWYPCRYDWCALGDWRPDPERFPRGLAPIGELCGKNGISLLLWFEPERVFAGSPLHREHPEWVLRLPDGTGELSPYGLVNLGDPACCDFFIETFDKIIKDSHVRIYRQDFNINPRPFWELHETEDRIGMTENLHAQGYLRLWDTLRERNPGLLIDSCASGGRRNDLETMRRAVTLHYTDVGYGIHPVKQKQHREMFEWIPYFRAHNMSWDDPVTGAYTGRALPPDRYAFYAAAVPAMTDMTRYDASDEAFALARDMKRIWENASAIMLSADFHPLTECRKSSEDFFAAQFHNEESDAGLLQIISNNRNPETVFTASLRGLTPGASYVFTHCETGEEAVFTEAVLTAGVPFSLPPRSGVIYFYHRT